MSITNDCLICLQTQNWNGLNRILSNEQNCKELNNDPIFQVFEANLVSEIKRLDKEETFDLPQLVLVRIFQLNTKNKIINLSDNCLNEIVEYLFYKTPSEAYAKLIPKNQNARAYLQSRKSENEKKIKNTIIGASLDIKIGQTGELIYSKKITNSPQEEELFRIANEILASKFVYPNISLSIIIDAKIISELTEFQKHIYLTSSIDLCIIDPHTLVPEYYFELDSAWHDNPRQIEKDRAKDEVFQKAGLTLIRIRKKQNKTMRNEFELLLEKHVS